MKRRELLKLAPMVAIAAVIPVLAKEEKQTYAPEFNGNPVISEVQVGEDGIPHITYIDPLDYYSGDKWTSEQLRTLKNRNAPPLKINKIS